jgi:hypothetical protein
MVNRARNGNSQKNIPDLTWDNKSHTTDFEKSTLFSSLLGETFKENPNSIEFETDHFRRVENFVESPGLQANQLTQLRG